MGQLHNHIQWVKDNHDFLKIIPMFVGPFLQASEDASPSEDMVVVELHQLRDLGSRISAALQDVARVAIPLNLVSQLHETLVQRDLIVSDAMFKLDVKNIKEM